MKQYRNFINGRFVESGKRFAGVNPATGLRFAEVHEATESMVDEAVAAGHQAVRGWGAASVADRADMLYRIADEIDRRAEDFLEAEVSDTGKPVSLASKLDIPRGAANFRIFADILKTAPLETFRTELADGAHAINYAVRKPLGVVGIISPWNLPLLLFSWKVAPALACGNAVVAKPSEETPGTATLLAEVMQSVGLPQGVFNLVHGFGPNSAGEFITKHPDISAITFTGESKTGRLREALGKAGKSLAASRPDCVLVYSTQWFAVL
ncbi:2-aminomuconic 6-semialdehyde dehydrogenase domain protein, partial [Bordetella hinzii 1277]|uniref:aldehyde dehydrogenase family protein n=1 Tax=Bordetella hinzii TaxID=103855 RepID=UPI00045AFC76